MTEFGDISDWIWLGFVAVWLLLRILPRLFRSRSQSTPQVAAAPPSAESPRSSPVPTQRAPAPRPAPQPPTQPPPRRQDPVIDQGLRTPKPIEPR